MTLQEGILYDKYIKLRKRLLTTLDIDQQIVLDQMEDARRELNGEMNKDDTR